MRMRLPLLLLVVIVALLCVDRFLVGAFAAEPSCDSATAAAASGECDSPFASNSAAASSADSVTESALDDDDDAIALRDVNECSVPRISASEFSSLRFLRDHYQRSPFILTNYSANSGAFRDRTSLSALLSSFGHEWITAASANTFSHTKMRIRFSAYVDLIRSRPITLQNDSATTKYFFGDHDDPNQFKSATTASDEADRAQREREASKRFDACVASNSSTVESCMEGASDAEDAPRKGPLWAPLLRRYQPPPFVLPHNLETEIAQRTAMSASKEPTAAAFSSLAGGIRRQAVSPDAARVLFDSADAEAEAEAATSSPSPSSAASAETLPPLFDYIRYSFGLGGHRSGVPFHVHGAAIGEVLHGQKRWWLVPPKTSANAAAAQPAKFGANSDSSLPFPSFRPELTQLQWLAAMYPSIPSSDRPLHCLLEAGQLLYVPAHWYHATLNIGETAVFISSFIDEGRMEGVFRSRGIDVDAIRRGEGADRTEEAGSN